MKNLLKHMAKDKNLIFYRPNDIKLIHLDITIGVLTENNARFVETTLGSILKQKIKANIEVIIIDNASIDQTQNCIRKFINNNKSFNATIFSCEKKTKKIELYKLILSMSHGKYIMFLDVGDWLREDSSLRLLKEKIEESDCIGAVGCMVDYRDLNGKIVASGWNEILCNKRQYDFSSLEKWQSPTYPNALLYNTSKLKEVADLLKDLCLENAPFDKIFYYCLLKKGIIYLLKDHLYCHRECQIDTKILSNGLGFSLDTYKSILLTEKYIKRYFKDAVSFLDAKLTIWKNICIEYYKNPNSKIKKCKNFIFSHTNAYSKLLFSYWKSRIKNRIKDTNDKANIIENDIPIIKEVDVSSKKRIEDKKDPNYRPMVSIGMTVYNQEQYVEKAIKSILSQKVNFDYEIVIAEDCSTDGTREIVEKYAKKYPSKIRLILQEHNIGLKAQSAMLRRECRGIYRTHLEGDDYWLTDDRLQKQVDFLEQHKDYIAVTGFIKLVDENDNPCSFPYGNINSIYCFKEEYKIGDFENWLLPSHTGALLYRNVFYQMDDELREKYEMADIPGDRKTALFLVMQGRIRCLNEYISVRRIEKNSNTNFTAINRKIKPYSSVYKWMIDLENFAFDLKGVKIKLSDQKELQWIYACNDFFKRPTKNGINHILKIYKMSKEKSQYRKIVLIKVLNKYNKRVKTDGRIKTWRIAYKKVGKMMASFFMRKDNNKEENKIINGESTK